jgi:hypothetical protein
MCAKWVGRLVIFCPPNRGILPLVLPVRLTQTSDATITITLLTQDEPIRGLGDGDTTIHVVIDADCMAPLRATRSDRGPPRVIL